MKDRIITYSQNREDLILDGFFKDQKKGFYVDVGASHPVVSSVTKYFYEKGWSGINIEPNIKQWRLLEEDRPRDLNLNIGISDKDSILKFREYEGYGLSTFSEDMMKEHETKKDDLTTQFKEYNVPVTTLKKVFEDHKVSHIDFLKIDVEGLEYQALDGNDWSKFRPEVICIESNHIFKDWRKLLEKNSYFLAFNDGLNDYYVAAESKNRADSFSFADSVLLGKPKIPLFWHQSLGIAEQKLYRRDTELRHQKNAYEELRRELEFTKQELFLQRKTRNLVKKIFRNIDANIIGLIKRLNEPKIKSVSKGIDLPDTALDSSTSKDALAAMVHQNDLMNFYSDKRTAGYKKNYSYVIANSVYFFVRSFFRLLFRGVRKLLKGLRKG